MKNIVLMISILFGMFYFLYNSFFEKKETLEEGIVYRELMNETALIKEPIQRKTAVSEFEFKGYNLKPLYKYGLKAVVLGKERYRFDASSELSTYDLILGWKEMALSEKTDEISLSQSFRRYRWRIKSFDNISRKQIEHNSANVHIIHANEDVLSVISNIDEGDSVSLYGYLIKASKKDGFRWKSSTTREDTGDGACEVFYVEYAKIES